jgi:hypothetical protein
MTLREILIGLGVVVGAAVLFGLACWIGIQIGQWSRWGE